MDTITLPIMLKLLLEIEIDDIPRESGYFKKFCQ